MRMRGEGRRSGMVLGTAVVLRAPLLPVAIPNSALAIAARAASGHAFEPLDVILITRDYELANGFDAPWARVIGIACGQPATTLTRSVPTVDGITDLLDSVADGSLVLLDGNKGLIVVDPDGSALAAYQGTHDSIAPQRRHYLEYEHHPAVTPEGRTVRIAAYIASIQEAEQAMPNGPDAFHITLAGNLIPPDSSDEEQLAILNALAVSAGGKPATIECDISALSMDALLRATFRCDMAVAMPYSREILNEFLACRNETRDAFINNDIDFGEFKVSWLIPPVEEFDVDDLPVGIDRLLADLRGCDELGGAVAEWLRSVVITAASAMLPVEVLTPVSCEASIDAALCAHSAGITVSPDYVQHAKEMARNYSSAV